MYYTPFAVPINSLAAYTEAHVSVRNVWDIFEGPRPVGRGGFATSAKQRFRCNGPGGHPAGLRQIGALGLAARNRFFAELALESGVSLS